MTTQAMQPGEPRVRTPAEKARAAAWQRAYHAADGRAAERARGRAYYATHTAEQLAKHRARFLALPPEVRQRMRETNNRRRRLERAALRKAEGSER